LDIVSDIALIVPTDVISDMLGVPKEKRQLLRGWSIRILSALDPVTTPEVHDAGNRAVDEFCEFLRELIAERRRNPEAGDRSEVLAELIFGEIDGERLSEQELLHNCIFILNAGHETTTSLTSHGVHILLSNPGELARLRADSGLIETAVEEFLRYQSSVQIGNRRTTQDVEIGGVSVPADTYLHLSIAGANRDPLEFPDPDRVDIGRTPNRHLAFGAGKYICLGLTLGRIEAQLAVGQLVKRFPNLRQIDDPVQQGRARFRGFNAYRVAV
jgi:cytochrome P450